MSAHDNMSYIIHYAAQLKSRRFTAEIFVLEMLWMRNQIPRISHCKIERIVLRY